MFGTVARLKVKPGKLDELMQLGEAFNEEAANIRGFVAEYFYKLDGKENELMMAVVFADRESYFANANDPRTHEFSQRMRALLDADPEWNDGEIVYSYTVEGR